MKRILITGPLGQDGRYLGELLSEEPETDLYGFTSYDRNLAGFVEQVRPHECYHLAAYHKSSQAGTDRDAASSEKKYLQTNVHMTHDLLSALREYAPQCRVFLAGSCHQFGPVTTGVQDEKTPMRPTSMYGITKLTMMQMGAYFRERGMHVSTGILFNHESPRRGADFITSRLAYSAARGEKIEVGDLDAMVDWGFAGDYVRAMVTMVKEDVPKDYVISSGERHTVREFAALAFDRAGFDYRDYVTEEPRMHKPVSVGYFGFAQKIRDLGWAPQTSFSELVRMMVDFHLGRKNGNS